MNDSNQSEYLIARIFIQCGGILGFVLSIACYAFAYLKLKINPVIKTILLFAAIQQAIGYAIGVSSTIATMLGFENRIMCYLIGSPIGTSMSGTPMCIAAISIARYNS